MVIVATNTLPSIINKSQGLIESAYPSQSTVNNEKTTDWVEIPTYTGDFVAIELETQLSGITQVEINGESYLPILDNSFSEDNPPSESNPLPVGYFWYDFENKTLYIGTSSNLSGLSVKYVSSSVPSMQSVEITDFPSWFSDFNIVGTFSINRSFQGQPSAQLTIIDNYKTKYSEIKSYFTKGKLFTIRGIGFRADNPQLKINEETGKMECVVNFKGKWESYNGNIDNPIDKPISINKLVGESGRDYYTISQVAGMAGVAFSGSSQKVYVSLPVPIGSTITLRSLLDDNRFYPEGKIIDWENPSSITLRSWGTMPSLTLSSYLPEIDITTGDKTKLTNAVLNLTKNSKGKGDVYQTLIEGRSDYQSPPKTLKNGYYESFDANRLRAVSYCFDVSSENTLYKVTEQLNGTDLTVLEETWGFVYSSYDVYSLTDESYYFDVSKALPDSLWQLVQTTEKTFNYDTETGYLISVTGTTKKLMRLKQESSELEAIKLALSISQETDETTIASLTKQLNAYKNFFWVSMPYQEDYILEDLTKHYPELGKEDTTNLKPKYNREMVMFEGAVFNYSNPESTEDNPLPDIVIGEEKNQQTEIRITDTRLKKYKETESVRTKKGLGLEDTISSKTANDREGIPSTSIRLQKLGFTDNNEENEGEVSTKYLISTDGAGLTENLENGSVSYADIKTINKALIAVKTEYSIINTQKEEILTITDKIPYSVVMGQIIQKGGVSYRLLQLTETYLINGGIYCDSMVYTLGKYQSVSASAKKITD